MLNFNGLDLTSPLNRIKAGRVALAVNVRAYLTGGFKLRNILTDTILTVSGVINTLARLNDTTPAGPMSGSTCIVSAAGTISNNATPVATGLSGNPVSLVPFRPDASVQPWMYVGDPSPDGNVTLTTKFAIDGSPSTFACAGMLKVRSDGLIYKTGIKEPQLAPVVSTPGTTTTGTASLPATTFPWTNVGGANTTYNYGHSSGADGTSPVIISTPTGSQTLTLAVTGTATVNGVSHAPGDAGPTGSTFPANFTGPGPTIVLGAFTNGSGAVLTGTSPVPLLANVGASITLQVPAGAANFQIGVDSAGNTFSANSGSFSVAWTLVTSAIATKISTLGNVTAYVWGDSPHTGPVASYIWKNPNDTGSATARTIGTAQATATNNSWNLNSTPQDGTVPVQWDTLDSSGTVVGTVPLFSPALESEGYQDFNCCIVGSLFVPTAGTYTFQLTNKDQVMVGIGGGATVAGGYVTNTFGGGQTMSVVSALPLVLVTAPNGSGTFVTTNFDVTFPGSGTYQVELDWDYWFHAGRSCSLIVVGAGARIPPLPQGVRTNVSYGCKYRSSLTGAVSNPGPTSDPQLTPVLDNTVSCAYSPDPQVDKVDYYRQDEGLPNYTYVATGPNTNPPTAIVDSLTDLAVAGNQEMQFDDFEPVPSIDLPQAGTCDVSGGVVTWVSGGAVGGTTTGFNTRWLAGTIMLIGKPTQLPYSFISRPTSTTTISIPEVSDGTNLTYNINEPILAAQPLAYLFGPTDNINFAFGVGDPLRPGTLYWCKGSNLDSWPDTNQLDVTDPSEALVNGAMSGGRGVLFSIKRAWVIMPNFFNALATVTGTSGSTWSLQDTSITRGLFIPRCLAVEGGGNIFFRVSDGIHGSAGGLQSQSITDGDLYPLFKHEGSTPTSVVRNGITIYPPDDSQPNLQKFSIIGNFLYYDYYAMDGNPHTLVYDIANSGWVWDMYSHPVTARAANEGLSTTGTLVGCSDGTVRQMASSGSETATGTVATAAIGGRGFEHCGRLVLEYSSNAAVSLTGNAVDAGNGSYGFATITLPSTGGVITKYYVTPQPNKWKLLAFLFQSTDPTLQVYLQGCVAYTKSWGSAGEYVPTPMFSAAGGEG